jgi:hypothetical protein
MTLRDRLRDWTDWDVAEWELARSLGLMHGGVRFHLEPKHVFWTDNSIGQMLRDVLGQLTRIGVLEFREEPDNQYRWNPDFRGSWERDSVTSGRYER